MAGSQNEMLNTYSAAQNIQVDNREAEARALMSCASRLRMALDDQGKDMKAYGDAIRHNHRLWIMFQVAICQPENQLPTSLKTIMMNLGRYVDRVSFRAVQKFSPDLVNSMIDINRTIAIGLRRKQPEAQTTQTGMTPPPQSAEQGAAASVMISA